MMRRGRRGGFLSLVVNLADVRLGLSADRTLVEELRAALAKAVPALEQHIGLVLEADLAAPGHAGH